MRSGHGREGDPPLERHPAGVFRNAGGTRVLRTCIYMGIHYTYIVYICMYVGTYTYYPENFVD